MRSQILDLRFFRGVLNGFDDVLVSGAATDVAFKSVANIFAGRAGVTVEQLRCGDDHAGRAVAALQSMSFPESFLHRMEFAVLREALNRCDRRSIRLDREHRARLYRLPIDHHGASSAE